MSIRPKSLQLRLTLSATLLATVVILLPSREASAIPAFARKYNVDCLTCHSAPPYLNYTGRRFKEAGYRMPDEDGAIDVDAQNLNKLTDHLYLEKLPPISVRVFGEPVRFGKGGEEEEGGAAGEETEAEIAISPAAEFELLTAGNFGSYGSYFVEFEAEDEGDFAAEGAGQVGYHMAPTFNVMGGWGGVFHIDPYNSLKDGGHRLSLAHKAGLMTPTPMGFGLHSDAYFLTLYGRADLLYYAVGYTGDPGNVEGNDARNFTARVAADFNENFSVGAFGWIGLKRDFEDPEDPTMTYSGSFEKAGVDANFDVDQLHGDAVFMVHHSKVEGATATDYGALAEVFYTYQMDGRPIFMPLARIDYKTDGDGEDTDVSGALQASTYVFENARLGVEGDFDISKPSGEEKAWLFSVISDIVF